ncbi:D-alanine--D-alanine ligase [Janthinobacterium sp. B9-8]|uniref:D-alanine--D-alanine ligase n=1 Tax=Janthinobacterium sp. B9-8 TaxID=1236179 RepID=UPI00061D1FBE|nr:D-alanine--D-alanine ligase [Janthinobacterium sp. B9-8]AMC34323.1 D-alanine--D-alanine ligase A [Janthinobacterium sp. B9-8]
MEKALVRLKVGILFGGKSVEHEVSLLSAKNVMDALDLDRFELVPIFIDKAGRWLLVDSLDALLKKTAAESGGAAISHGQLVSFVPGGKGRLVHLSDMVSSTYVDVVFPVLHGLCGEDGSIQGLLRLAGVPYVGSEIIGSAIGMDKDVSKRLLREAGIPVAPFYAFKRGDAIDCRKVLEELGLPVFVKPASLGSSVGVAKVEDASELQAAIDAAFKFDAKVLVEKFIEGREIECAVLGNDDPIASVVGEISSSHDFYSYEAKYVDKKTVKLTVPASIDSTIADRVRTLSVQSFHVLCCTGMARIDFFLSKDGSLLVNEINTIPGFTSMSMYPLLWQATGLAYRELISQLIELAMQRFALNEELKTSF